MLPKHMCKYKPEPKPKRKCKPKEQAQAQTQALVSASGLKLRFSLNYTSASAPIMLDPTFFGSPFFRLASPSPGGALPCFLGAAWHTIMDEAAHPACSCSPGLLTPLTALLGPFIPFNRDTGGNGGHKAGMALAGPSHLSGSNQVTWAPLF